MSLVYGGVAKDNMGKTVPYYIDTDDLDDAEYHYLRKVERYREIDGRARKLYSDILNSRVSAQDIESISTYAWVNDDLALLVLEEKLNSKKGACHV